MKDYLDDIDLQILRLLQDDGRMTNAALATHTGLAPASVLARVRRLEAAGYIRGFAALLDPEKVGLRLTVWALISLSLHQDQPIERFRRAIGDLPEVTECYNISGESDFLLKIVVSDIRAYEALIRDKLSRIQGIQHIKSSFVLSTTKHTTRLPI